MGLKAEPIQKTIKDPLSKLHHIENALGKLIIRTFNCQDWDLPIITKITTERDSFFRVVFIADTQDMEGWGLCDRGERRVLSKNFVCCDRVDNVLWVRKWKGRQHG